MKGCAQEADIDTGKNLPDRAHHIPRNEQRQRHEDKAERSPEAPLGHVESNEDAERDLDGEDHGREDQLAAKRIPKAPGMQHVIEPFDAGPEELVVAERVLHRVVHHRHQRDDRREGDKQKHGKDQEPGLVIDCLFHQAASPVTRQLSA